MDNNNTNNTPTNVVSNDNFEQPTPIVQPTVPTTSVAPVQPTPVETHNVPETSVDSTPVQPINGGQNSNSLESEKNNNNGLYLVFGIILVVVIAMIVYFLLSEMNSKDVEENNEPETNQNENANQEKDNTENENIPSITQPTTTANLSSWNGKYTNGTIDIIIYQNSENLVNINITNNNGASTIFDTEVESDTTISYEDEFFEDINTIQIEKTATGINVTASSTDTENLLNSVNGEYTKNTYTSYNWNGIYTNGDTRAFISEIDQDYIMCTITKGYSVNSFGFDSVTETELKYEDSFDGEVVTVTKTDNGVQITASSTETENLLNEVSGTYIKK